MEQCMDDIWMIDFFGINIHIYIYTHLYIYIYFIILQLQPFLLSMLVFFCKDGFTFLPLPLRAVSAAVVVLDNKVAQVQQDVGRDPKFGGVVFIVDVG